MAATLSVPTPDWWHSMNSNFWHSNVWLPPGYTWDDVTQLGFPNCAEMLQPVFLSFILIAVRIAFEWCIARPIGVYCGLEDTGSVPCAVVLRCLWSWWTKNNNHNYNNNNNKSNNNKQHYNNVQQHQQHNGPSVVWNTSSITKSKLDKFCEHSWRFTFYVSAFIYGLWALRDKPWLWDATHFWFGYPHHSVPVEIAWYYKIEAGFYWSLMISQFTDIKRKDYLMMYVHHVATLLLLWFSWTTNFVRVGSVILLLHDAADVWLDFGKMLRFLGAEFSNLCTAAFFAFATTWILTRCILLPYQVVYSVMVEAPSFIVFFPVYYIFNVLLIVLQVLHVIWTYMIIRTTYSVMTVGAPKDVRSDDEDD